MKRTGKSWALLCAVLLALALCALLSACISLPKVYFDPNFEGAKVLEQSISNGVKLPTNVTREGYLLEGWYLEQDCQTLVEDISKLEVYNGVTFYAKWKALPKSLSLNYGGLVFQNGVLPKSEISATVTYWDGETKPVTDFVIDLSNVSANLGETYVSATYTENGTTVTGTLTVNVLKVAVQSISATYNGSDILVGGTLSESDFSVRARYTNGAEKAVTSFTTSGFSSETAGNKTVTISYTEGEVTKTTTVSVRVVEQIELSSISAEYVGGDVLIGGTLSKNNITVKAHYTNGTEKTVTDFETSDFSSDTAGNKIITVFYAEKGVTKTATISVKVVEPVKLSSISVIYNGGDVLVGGTLSTGDFTVKAQYTDHTEKTVTGFTESGFSSETAGDKTVTISYTENGVTQTTTVTVKVVEQIVLSSITVEYGGSDVLVGGTLAKADVTVKAHYTSGTEKTVTNFELSGFSSETAGDKTVTISYTENGVTKTTTVTVKVVEQIVLSSITAEYGGSDIWLGGTLAKSDVTVKAHYTSGTEKTVTNFELSGFSSETAGNKTVTVSYTEDGATKQCQLVIKVVAPTLQSLSAHASGRKIYVGDTFDNSFLTVSAQYSDGASNDVLTFTLTSVWDSSVAGNKTVTVSYTDEGVTKTATTTVEVLPLQVVSISAEYVGGNIWIGGTLAKSDVTVKAHYTNGTEKTVTDFDLSNFSSETAGTKIVTVSYTQDGITKTTTVSVEVLPLQVVSISAEYVGGALWDDNTLTSSSFRNLVRVTLTHNNGSTSTTEAFTISGFVGGQAGAQTVTVSYANLTTQLSVTVQRRALTGISATYNGTVRVGEQPNASGFTVTASFNNGTTQSVTNFTVGVLDSATAGTKQVEISFTWDTTTKSCKTNVTVVDSGTVANSNLSIHFLELGNQYSGDCVYIKAGDTDILIDAGSRAGSAATIGKYVDQFCTDGKLEYVIATHAHQDHIAGFVGTNSAKGIFDKYECQNIIQFARTEATTQVYKDYCAKRDAEVANGANLFTALECYNESKDGAQRVYDLTGDGSITMEILYQRYYENKASSSGGENDYSVCVMLHQGENHYLLTGDLEEDGEASLVESNPNLPEVVLFKGGHHGSYTASNETLLSKIKPQYVCVCCCAGNVEYLTTTPQNLSHSFPAQEMIDRVAKYTDRVYVTTLGRIKWDESKNKWVNDSPSYESMNGNIVFSCVNGVISLQCSNNNLKLKDTEWFKNNRTCPKEWQEGTQTPSMYH